MDRSEGAGNLVGAGPATAHLIGSGGAGMAGLAQLLAGRGTRVSLSGPVAAPLTGPLRRAGVQRAWFTRGSMEHPAEVVVFAATTPRTQGERLRARRCGIPQRPVPALLGRLVGPRRLAAMVGGRGASLATAMAGWILVRNGWDPTLLLGQPSVQLGGAGRWGAGPLAVLDLPEVPGAGWEPAVFETVAILDRPGSDRGSREAADHGSRPAAGPGLGSVLAWDECPGIEDLTGGPAGPVARISVRRCEEWWGTDLRQEPDRLRFRAFHRRRFVAEVRLAVSGRRAVVGALAAAALCLRWGVPTPAIKEGLEEFNGLARGGECRGFYRGVTVMDDAATCPEEVADALSACRDRFPTRRLWAVFDPGAPVPSASRARYATAFVAADRVVIVERDSPRGGRAPYAGGPTLVGTLAAAGLPVRGAPRPADAVTLLERRCATGDVLVTLGGSEVGKVADALTRRLPRHCHGR